MSEPTISGTPAPVHGDAAAVHTDARTASTDAVPVADGDALLGAAGLPPGDPDEDDPEDAEVTRAAHDPFSPLAAAPATMPEQPAYDPSEHTVDEVLTEYVKGDPDRAAEVLRAEQADDKPRVTLVDALRRLIPEE